jgi:hypothetical protein
MVNTDLFCPMTHSKPYHRLVKTTPKPRATKKRSGELEPPGPPDPPVLLADGAVELELAVAVTAKVEVDIMKRKESLRRESEVIRSSDLLRDI